MSSVINATDVRKEKEVSVTDVAVMMT